MVIRPLDDFTWCAQSVVADNSDPSVWGTWESGWAHSVAGPCIPISSLLTHMVYLLLFFELFSWLQKRFRPSDPNTITNTALEVTASSSGKNSRHVDSRRLPNHYSSAGTIKYMYRIPYVAKTRTCQPTSLKSTPEPGLELQSVRKSGERNKRVDKSWQIRSHPAVDQVSKW